jgi:hypothetical protein
MDYRTLHAQHQRAVAGLKAASLNLADVDSRCANSACQAALMACRRMGEDTISAFHRSWSAAILTELAIAREVHRGFDEAVNLLSSQLATPEMVAEATNVEATDAAQAIANAEAAAAVRARHAQERAAEQQGIEDSFHVANQIRQRGNR